MQYQVAKYIENTFIYYGIGDDKTDRILEGVSSIYGIKNAGQVELKQYICKRASACYDISLMFRCNESLIARNERGISMDRLLKDPIKFVPQIMLSNCIIDDINRAVNNNILKYWLARNYFVDWGVTLDVYPLVCGLFLDLMGVREIEK